MSKSQDRADPQRVMCHICGRQTRQSDERMMLRVDGPPYYYCPTCWEQHERTYAEQQVQELRRLDATALQEGEASALAMVLPAAPGPAPASQLLTAIVHEEVWTRATYRLLHEKRRRSLELVFGETDPEPDVAEGEPIPEVAKPFRDCPPDARAWWRGYYTDPLYGEDYQRELEMLLNEVLSNLSRLRQLVEPLYEPDFSVLTEPEKVGMVFTEMDKVQRRVALEQWQYDQRENQ